MRECGYEMIFECAWFWCSRSVWNEEADRYEIRDVIGPDEYTEHIDNNAYTNYIAQYVVSVAVRIFESLHENDIQLLEFLDGKLGLKERYEKYRSVSEKLYLPKADGNGIIPQDDTFLSKGEIDISKYRNHPVKQAILLDYSRDRINDLQILKQADVVMLMHTLKGLFDKKTMEANWKYYEARTIHDSSLSMAVHSIVAAYFEDLETAYKCFLEACCIDMGQNPESSDAGIHAASMGGIWMSVIFGFGGVFNNEGVLELNPALPGNWQELSFGLVWRNNKTNIKVDRKRIVLTSEDSSEISLKIWGKSYSFKNRLEIEYTLKI